MPKTAKTKKTDNPFAWEEKGSWRATFVRGMFDEENEETARLLREASAGEKPRVFVVADANVVQHTPGLGTAMGRYFAAHEIEMAGAPAVTGGGEKIKADMLQTAWHVLECATAAGVGGGDLIVAIGGGALLDVASFAAANLRGGVRIVRVPTTPAAMADTAFADFASLDMPYSKDAICVKSRPSAVIIDPSFASGVLDGVWRGGLGEIIRLCYIGGKNLLDQFEDSADYLRCRDIDVLDAILRECLALREKKSIPPFGLWSAIKLQSMSGYKLPHGYAVPMGMCIDTGYAVEKGLMEMSERDRLKGLLADCGALDGLSHSHHLLSQPEQIVEGMDEWRRHAGGMRPVPLAVAPGKVVYEDEPDLALYEKVVRDFLSEAIGA